MSCLIMHKLFFVLLYAAKFFLVRDLCLVRHGSSSIHNDNIAGAHVLLADAIKEDVYFRL